jgi:hypothetical protein
MKTVITKVTLTGIFLLGFIVLTATQCSENKKDGSLKNALIWRITGDNLPEPSYIFGTVHVVDSANSPIHKTVFEQLKRSDVLVLETDLTTENYQQKALEHAMMANDSIEGIMTTEEYETVRSFFLKEFRFPVEVVKKMKPFYLASLIGSLQSPRNSTSHEQFLMKVAQEAYKPIRGLSTLDKESDILSRISVEEQVDYLLDEIGRYKSGISSLQQNEIMEAYENAEIEKIHSMVYEALSSYDSIYTCMFSMRNRSWLPEMIRLMQEESCFFAVGVGHLAGESGLIRLLIKEGYKVVPVHLDFWFHD